jgi:ATP adenylyltransferase
VNEERLWAPWRLQYVTGGESSDEKAPQPKSWLAGADETCFLCRAAADFADTEIADKQLHVVERGDAAIVVLNRYPYNNGHLLIAPRRHVGDLSGMTREEHVECMEFLAQLTNHHRTCLNADGFNVGLNLGRVAGAGLPGHLHWHLVPRWAGDNNFMPVLAGTRVIPQSLDELWKMLTDVLRESNRGGGHSTNG